MADPLNDLASDPIIVSMAADLVEWEKAPADEGDLDYADYVFAAAMEFTFRGGDIEGLDFSDPAEAVRLAYLDLGGRPRS